MKTVGIFACNYNKKDFILKCVESVLRQTFRDYDLYVVDNASTDDSADALKSAFGSRLNLLINQENVGGAGGFNRGLREGIRQKYRYIILLDNDIILDENAVSYLYEYMEEHKEAGAVGAKIMMMRKPELIQEYGSYIDFDNYRTILGYHNMCDDGTLPSAVECDFVPACACIIRTGILDKTGLLPEGNFIYWDDMELGYRINQAGYKVYALGKAKVWHNFSGYGSKENGFIRYYSIRNKIGFFSKYLQESRTEDFAQAVLMDIFSRIYGDYHKGRLGCLCSTIHALEDAVYGIQGKAGDFKIDDGGLDRKSPLEILLDSVDYIHIRIDQSFDYTDDMKKYVALYKVTKFIKDYRNQVGITVSEPGMLGRDMTDNPFFGRIFDGEENLLMAGEPQSGRKLTFVLCPHVKRMANHMIEDVYVDEWMNCLCDKKDYVYFNNDKEYFSVFERLYKSLLLNRIFLNRENDGGIK